MTEINKKVAIAHNGCFAGVGTGRLPSQNRGLYTKRDNDMANKIYKNREILNSDKGLVDIKPDGFFISEVRTKPNGSNSEYLSIGKFSKRIDEFGDSINIWEHFSYPNKFSLEGFAFKSEYSTGWNERHRASTKIEWKFKIPKTFIEQGFGLAIIGTGIGGSGHRKNAIEVFFDKDRLDRECKS